MRSEAARASLLTQLQRLQIFNQIVPLLVGQRAANDARLARTRRSLERVAENTVAVDRLSVACGRREPGFTLVASRHFAGDHAKTDLLRIEVAGAHAELRGTLGGGFEQPVERR